MGNTWKCKEIWGNAGKHQVNKENTWKHKKAIRSITADGLKTEILNTRSALNSAKALFYLARAFFTSSVSLGTILKRSPTMPTSATLKIGAVLSLLMAMM